LSLLSYGPKFALPMQNSKLHWPKVVSDVEAIVKTAEDEESQNSLRMNLVNVLKNFKSRPTTREDPSTRHITKCFNDAKSFLKSVAQEDLIVTVADKGGKTVVMPATEYKEQMENLTSDGTTYKKVNYDLTNRVQTKSNKLVTKLLEKGYITKREKMNMHRSNSVAPKLYGLPKIHKLTTLDNAKREKVKMRPIVSCIDSPLINLSKFMSRILHASIDQSKYNVNSSFELCQELKSIKIPPGYIIVSFDVVSLFTVIPPNLVMAIIEERWQIIKKHTSIDKILFLEIMKHIMDNSFFQHNDSFYLQLCGSPMGDAASPVQADFVLDFLLDECRKKFDFPIPLLKKYVDDLVLIVPENKVKYIQEVFNDFHQNIKFTVEEEMNGEIPYLDMILKREADGTIKTDWYMKPIASGRIINYLSSHPSAMKINTAKNLISRIAKLSSDGLTAEKRRVAKSLLVANNYPSAVCNRLLHTYNRPRKPTELTTKPTIFRSFANIPSVTTNIQKLANRVESNVNLRLCPSNSTTARCLYSKLKDPINSKHISNVIYKIPCSCGKSYIGFTTQYRHCRAAQHKRGHDKIFELRGKGLNDDHPEMEKALDKCTALVKHVAETNHRFDFGKIETLDKGKTRMELKMLEMIHIKRNSSTTVNFKSDVENLSNVFSCLF
jgi:hypothetical protein